VVLKIRAGADRSFPGEHEQGSGHRVDRQKGPVEAALGRLGVGQPQVGEPGQVHTRQLAGPSARKHESELPPCAPCLEAEAERHERVAECEERDSDERKPCARGIAEGDHDHHDEERRSEQEPDGHEDGHRAQHVQANLDPRSRDARRERAPHDRRERIVVFEHRTQVEGARANRPGKGNGRCAQEALPHVVGSCVDIEHEPLQGEEAHGPHIIGRPPGLLVRSVAFSSPRWEDRGRPTRLVKVERGLYEGGGMGEVTSRAQLIDAPKLGARSQIAATLPRTEIEEALRMEETPELILDFDSRSDGEVEAHTLRVAWSDDQLKELLRDTGSEDITLFFDAGEIEEALADEDIEAHGMREKTAAVLTVAAMAAGAAAVAHPAYAKTAVGGGGGSGAGATIEMVSDAASSGAATAPELISDAASGPGVEVAQASGPQLVSDAASGPGIEAAQASGPQLVSDAASGPGIEAAQASGPELVSDTASTGTPSPAQSTASAGAVPIADDSGMSSSQIAETAAGSGLVLLLTAAGFAVRGKRRHEQPA